MSKIDNPSVSTVSPDAYTTANVTTTRALDPTTSTIDDLYNVLASLIVSLKGAGILQ